MKARSKTQHELLADERIIELYWSREESAITETDRKYGQLLYQIAHRILNDRLDSEECQNDTYLKVWNTVPPTRPTVLRSFLAKISRNLALNRYKEKNRQKRVPSELTVAFEDLENTLQGGESAERELAAAELGVMINDYVHTLALRGQYVFVGRYYFAESVEEIAKALQMTKSNVYKQLEEIKKGLKQYLEERGERVE
ncbi:MAG: sigma-70 family RNA polymerase sigma factor [Clostridia bacterium]|nr:sigma-70 family RNA polymerase sigma factor [Clostridia bacterium]